MITICKIDKWHASSFLWRANYFKFICSKQNNDEEKHDFTTGFSMPFKDSLERAYRLPDSLLWESSLWQHDHRQRWEKSWTKDWQQDLRRTPVGCSLSLFLRECSSWEMRYHDDHAWRVFSRLHWLCRLPHVRSPRDNVPHILLLLEKGLSSGSSRSQI